MINNKFQGVGYNTVNSINTINKENKENKVERTSPLSSGKAIAFSKPRGQEVASLDASRVSVTSSPTPQPQDPYALISENNVAKCHIGFYDNGPDAIQQYKLKATIIFADNTQAEFIASLTKDRRNFIKHLPPESKEQTIQEIDEVRQHIRSQFDVKPYIGKFHYNTGFGSQETKSQIEPYTWACVYYNSQERVWAGMLSIYGLKLSFDLFSENLSVAQKRGNMKAKESWINPKFNKDERPKTWAQRQQGTTK